MFDLFCEILYILLGTTVRFDQNLSRYGVPYTIRYGTVRTTVSIGIAKLTPDDAPVPAI